MPAFRITTEPILLLYYSIVYINYSVLPQLILKKLCVRAYSYNTTLCANDATIPTDIHKEATRWWFYLLLSFQVPGVLTVLVSGPVSDIIGRLKCLKCIPLLDALGTFVFLLTSHFIGSHPAFMIPGYLMRSLFGEAQGVLALSFAFVADVTKDKQDHRTPRMALGESSVHLGGVIGGLIANSLLQEFGFVFVFVFSIFIDVLIYLYISCYLSNVNEDDVTSLETTNLIRRDGNDETDDDLDMTHETDSSVDDEGANRKMDEIGDGFTYIKSYFKQLGRLLVVLRERKIVVLMIVTFMFIYFGVIGEQLIQALYLKHAPFNFSSIYVGYYTAVQGVSRFAGTIIISQISFYCFYCNDFTLMIIGALSQIASFIFIGLSRSTVVVYFATAAGFALPLSMMTIRSVLTKNVLAYEFGTILSLLASLNILAAICTNTVSSFIHEITLSEFAGVAYLGLATFSAVGLLIIIVTYVTIGRRQNGNTA